MFMFAKYHTLIGDNFCAMYKDKNHDEKSAIVQLYSCPRFRKNSKKMILKQNRKTLLK